MIRQHESERISHEQLVAEFEDIQAGIFGRLGALFGCNGARVYLWECLGSAWFWKTAIAAVWKGGERETALSSIQEHRTRH